MAQTAKPVQAMSQKPGEDPQGSNFDVCKKGYHSTTVDEIAAEAGVSTGIACRCFRNEKDLLHCCR